MLCSDLEIQTLLAQIEYEEKFGESLKRELLPLKHTAEEYLKILQSCLASGKAYDSDKPEMPSEDWDFEFSKWQAKYKSTFGRQLATEQMPQLSLQELVSIIKQCLNNGKAYEYLELPEDAIS